MSDAKSEHDKMMAEWAHDDEAYMALLRDNMYPIMPALPDEDPPSAITELKRRAKRSEVLEEMPSGLEAEQKAMPTPADRKVLKEGDSPFHFESGKARLDQLPPKAVEAVGRVFGYGATKYGEWNWAVYATEWSDQQLIGSALRHIIAYQRGEDIDPESGHTHLMHAAANMMMLFELKANNLGRDERNPIYKEN